jgi:(1->4)-alpha-D-glucan 1-alpha-D-glucosylmutase
VSALELRATYRLQLGEAFGFDQARALIPYLRDLGISHLYLSPAFQARPGSTHGYDIVDPRRISDALGGEDGLRTLSAAARAAGMGVVLDIVPNHMAADDANRRWSDPALRARFFDLDPASGRWRRFFDIDELAGVRQEDPAVFDETHETVLALVSEGVVDGLRVDHPDGLADPAAYFARLRQGGARRVWVEKILDPGERLRDWPVCGTVGYEFLNDVCALFVDPAGEAPLTRLWERVSGDRRSFGDVAREAKLEQLGTTFRPELERLARLVPDLAPDVIADALASLPVYRTYVDPAAGTVVDADRAALEDVADPVARRVLLETPAPAEFVTRFQQTTPAVMAKGVEDTAFYRYLRLLSLCEVGGDPGRFCVGVDRFHSVNAERARRWPEALLTTMTHDAKRSGDVRLRIAMLSALAEEWEAGVTRWLEVSERYVSGDGAPDLAERYLLLQTLAGAWPIEPDRLRDYMLKALREAKRNTNWVDQNTEWEQAALAFTDRLVVDAGFLQEFEPFAARVAEAGRRAALGQLALKLTAPGVPDTYQGDELEFRALVDPDNRRPVDWDLRQALLGRLLGGGTPDEESRKLLLTLRLLVLRARRPEPFCGAYEPLDAGDDACAFVRGGDVFVVVATRPLAPVEGVLRDPPGGRWREVLSGQERSFSDGVAVSSVVGEWGLAVYERV